MRSLIAGIEATAGGRLEQVLRRRGHAVTMAAGLESALETHEREPYVLILIDLRAGPAVLELCRRVRAAAHGSRPIVVALVSRTSPGLLEGAIDAGVDDFMPWLPDDALLEMRVRLYERIAADRERQAKAEREQRHSQEWFLQVFRASPAAMTISTVAEGRFMEVSDAFLALSGYRRQEIIGKSSLELRLWANPEDRPRALQAARAGVLHSFETQLRRHTGEVRETLVALHMRDLVGQPCLLALYYDVTERKRLEDQLRQSQKMEAIGRLAGGVAHDFNNILTAIMGYCELLLLGLEPGTQLARSAEQIERSAERATTLVRQLLALGRKQVVQPVVLDLNAVIASLGGMLQRLIGEDIALHITLAPSPGRIRADRGQIEQVLLNLVVNARDAMPKGGQLHIETAEARLDDQQLLAAGLAPDATYLMLTVADTGVGMDAETQAHMFEPFFTTKEKGKGTGLGLSMVYGIVEQSGGKLLVRSRPGEGAVFEVFLPRVDDALEPVAVEAPAAPPPRGDETILLVEDDEAVRGFVSEVLRSFGYRVLAVGDGAAALREADHHTGSIELLLSDVIMPRMHGSEVADRLITLRPEMKVLYMSGYPGSAIMRHGVLESGRHFLQKPFTVDSLARKVRAVIDEA